MSGLEGNFGENTIEPSNGNSVETHEKTKNELGSLKNELGFQKVGVNDLDGLTKETRTIEDFFNNENIFIKALLNLSNIIYTGNQILSNGGIIANNIPNDSIVTYTSNNDGSIFLHLSNSEGTEVGVLNIIKGEVSYTPTSSNKEPSSKPESNKEAREIIGKRSLQEIIGNEMLDNLRKNYGVGIIDNHIVEAVKFDGTNIDISDTDQISIEESSQKNSTIITIYKENGDSDKIIIMDGAFEYKGKRYGERILKKGEFEI